MTASKLPTLYLPHGGGPCFFMEWTMGPRDMWDKMAAYLRNIEKTLPQNPKALLVISAHWETQVPTVLAQEAPPLLFDYYGFPPHTYQLTWPAPGDPALAKRVQGVLTEAGIPSGQDTSRGFDHGVFIPLKLAFSEAKIPTVQLSLKVGLDPAEHLAIGRALAPLREEGVLIIGSGMSYHNMRGFMDPNSLGPSQRFDAWLAATSAQEPTQREQGLTQWRLAPSAKECHPREEHLLPLMVVAGAAREDAGQAVFQDQVMGVVVSAIQFG
jgi:aromatic ring-opening dioxygenase catalytic subunit (LigB family)